MSESDTTRSSASMEDKQLDDEVPPERIEPFAKMSQMAAVTGETESPIPVRFRRNIFQDGPLLSDPAEDNALNVEKQVYHKPARHMRAQPRVAYSSMDPEQRQQAELLDTALVRQQLLLRQQQEVMAMARQQHLDHQAQQLVNQALVMPPHPPTAHPNPQADRQALGLLLNEACILAPPHHPPRGGGGGGWAAPGGGGGWAPPVLSPQGGGLDMTMLVGVGAAPPGGPPGGGFPAMTQEELMQAVRKELKRMQQE